MELVNDLERDDLGVFEEAVMLARAAHAHRIDSTTFHVFMVCGVDLQHVP